MGQASKQLLLTPDGEAPAPAESGGGQGAGADWAPTAWCRRAAREGVRAGAVIHPSIHKLAHSSDVYGSPSKLGT